MNNLKHIAFIMDGNGRWAKQKGMPRTYGHLKGVESLKKVVNACFELGIEAISLFAFSTENWNRPQLEVNYLMKLLKDNLNNKDTLKWFKDHDVRFVWNGQKTNLSPQLITTINDLMEQTKDGKTMTIQIMFNYGSRLAIIDAVNELKNKNSDFNVENLSKVINKYNLPDLDLLIRTSGENRISNFMLWELSYSEIIFNPVYWPDYCKEELEKDIQIYKNRQRRFGGL